MPKNYPKYLFFKPETAKHNVYDGFLGAMSKYKGYDPNIPSVLAFGYNVLYGGALTKEQFNSFKVILATLVDILLEHGAEHIADVMGIRFFRDLQCDMDIEFQLGTYSETLHSNAWTVTLDDMDVFKIAEAKTDIVLKVRDMIWKGFSSNVIINISSTVHNVWDCEQVLNIELAGKK